MTRRASLPAHLGAAFATAAAQAAGVQRSRLRAADLEAPFRGARVREQPPGDEVLARCRAFAAIAGQPFAFSHATAARLYGIPMPVAVEGSLEIHVTVRRGAQPPRMRGVTGHSGAVGAARRVSGLPVVAPELVWRQLAAALSVDELIAAGDHLARRRDPQSSIDRLTRMVDDSAGARGVALLRCALAEIRPGTESPRETLLRLVVVRAGLPEPVVAHPVFDERGRLIGTPDLAFIAEKVALEYEGDVHRTDLRTFRQDIERRERFQEAGWLVIRITGDHLRNPQALVARIERALTLRSR